MPRPKRPGAPEPKRRSRKGCWPCKARKVKWYDLPPEPLNNGEEKPSCSNCQRQGETCDYSIRLNWDGRSKRKSISGIPQSQTDGPMTGIISFGQTPNQPSQSVMPNLVPGGRNRATPPDTGSGRNAAQQSSLSPPGFQAQGSPQDLKRAHSKSSQDSLVADHNVPPPQHPELDIKPQSAQLLQLGGASVDRITQPQPSPLPHPGRFSYLSPTASNLASPSQGAMSTLGYNAVTQPVSYLRQTSLPEEAPHEGHSLYKFPAHSGSSEEYSRYEKILLGKTEHTGLGAPAGIDKVHKTPLSQALSPYSQHNTSSVHSPSNQTTVQHTISGLGAGTRIPSGVDSAFSPSETVDNFGIDCGHPDLDLNRNNDAAAIKDISTLDTTWQTDPSKGSPKSDLGLQRSETVFAKGGYYSVPVLVNIPRNLNPLPDQLLHNPMNLLYFHHFLNHTARILVPHDCSDNPFRVVLPSMAVEDTNLLNLLLAYSASHRARLLSHDEPWNRIAHWVSDVFPALRQAVDNVDEKTADTRVATALMLTSLKIISPSTFDTPIPWQDHLRVARSLFVARGGTQPGQPTGKVGQFLARWLAYLDILGSLSCRKNDLPLFGGSYWAARAAEKGTNDQSGFHVDCFTGFSSLCSSLLARLGELTHRCYHERIDEKGTVHWDFSPSIETQADGEQLLEDMNNALAHDFSFSPHHGAPNSDDSEMAASNHAFHWAGIIHLYRRVLDRDSLDSDVLNAVNALLDSLSRIRRGGSAEVCLLFPLFTAGCETRDPQHRNDILERIKSFEGVGMKQIRNARELMERSWAEDLPWILLTKGEFLG
ncbi:hypothetical protein FQN54_007115 [Arachnomyces sp. PD_36]|nr:hypothetical protein FQN54_007115 [Arachnomyces sp. PD_36]